jgi:hypothetical protein
MNVGCKPKLTRQQIDHARKPIDDGQRRDDVAALLNVDRTTLYRVLHGWCVVENGYPQQNEAFRRPALAQMRSSLGRLNPCN